MSELAVADPPVETPEPKSDDLAEAKGAISATDGTEAEPQTGEPGDETPEDHAAELDREKAEADEALLNQRAEQLAEEKRVKDAAEAREKGRKDRIRNARTTAVTRFSTLADRLDAALKAEGKQVAIERKPFTDIIEALNLDIEEAKTEELNDRYKAGFDAALGDEAEDFWKDAEALADDGGDADISALVDLAVEKKALKSKTVRNASLKDLTDASPKARKELADRDKKEYERGLDDGIKSPSGAPRGSSTSASNRVSYTTKTEARNLHAQNKITSAEMRSVNANPNIPEF